MVSCERCLKAVTQRFTLIAYDEKQDFSKWAAIDDMYAHFTGEITLNICIDCFISLTGRPPADVQPPKNLFHIRTLQSGIAVEIAKALFEHCGYEVRHTGYEYTTPEWVNRLKCGDPNPAVAFIRGKPDLTVYDHRLNSVYEVEVKSTGQASSRWRVRKDDIDTQRHYHPEAILMVYVQHEHEFYACGLRRIDWEDIATYTYNAQVYYEVDLKCSLLKPTQIFGKLTPNDYFPFQEGVKKTLAAFQ
jgi:hypothetical protein